MSATHCCCMTRKLHIRHGGRIRRALLGQSTRPGKSINIERNAPRRSHSSPSGLFAATVGFSIGLDAGIFRDVAGAEVPGAARALSRLTHSPSMALRAAPAGNGPHCPWRVRRCVYAGSRLFLRSP